MKTTNKKINPSKYEFTVKRISLLQTLLCRADKKTVNRFIDDVRRTVYFYHAHQHETVANPTIQEQEKFFNKLNDKAHQLARFITELSSLVNEAPLDLQVAAKQADSAIDAIHDNLVNLCLTIDNLNEQKINYVIDLSATVKTIYDAYCRVFNTLPNGRYFVEESDIPFNAPLEDLLVPVVHILTLKDLDRSYKLVQGLTKKV